MDKNHSKIFVLDTNVILHDSSCLRQFEDNDIVIPITVLEELDHFKKGNGSLNYHARQFVRDLDAVSANELFDGGIELGPGLGKVMVKFERSLHSDLVDHFSRNEPDHAILNTAYHCAKKHPARPVILVSKDVNLRMKAKSIGLQAEDYITDHVKDVADLYRGYRQIDDVPDEAINALYLGQDVPADSLELGEAPSPLSPNEFLILRNASKSALAAVDTTGRRIRHVEKRSVYGISPRNAEQTFAVDALINPAVQLVTISGKAGTGKTLLALAGALECRRSYRQIYLARPIVPLSNRDIGYLPGDIQSKLDPYMQPLYDNLGVIRDQFAENHASHKKINQLLETEKLKIAPLSYIRGRSLVRVFFIVDEAQNLTPHEVKTVITRAGADTKVVFTGDIFQIDHPYIDKHSNGLSYLIERMRGQAVHAHVNLVKGERSHLAELASNLL
jgi:PhoH-like ATPase